MPRGALGSSDNGHRRLTEAMLNDLSVPEPVRKVWYEGKHTLTATLQHANDRLTFLQTLRGVAASGYYSYDWRIVYPQRGSVMSTHS